MSQVIDLYTGPWRKGDHGVAVIALKRIVSRARPDLFPWRKFDANYNERLRHAISVIQAGATPRIVPATGNTGEPTFRMLMKLYRQGHPKESAADATAVNLLEEAWGQLHPPVTPAQKVQDEIAAYCQAMETYNQIWHYLQRRAMTTLGVAPPHGGRSDCSEFATTALWWARKQTGVYVPDPNGRGYDGYGNTDTIWNTNRHNQVTTFQVADMAIYGASWKTDHVTVCRHAGDRNTAIFSSNGSEAGPLPTRVYYRGDLLAVVRPRLVP